jgi:prepilin-type N-terminal cleavage/methylation domain-containing protein
MRSYKFRRFTRNGGFSMTELLVVLGIMGLMAVISLPYIVNYRKLYRSEDQALKVIDLMQETAQLALTRRRTFRFEINLTDNAALIIDENGTNPAFLVKRIPLDQVSELRVDTNPSGITRPNPPNYANAAFSVDGLGHLRGSTTVIGHTVWAARFRSDTSVIDAAGNPLSATLFIWPPAAPGSSTARNQGEVRAITIFGGSGAIKYWKYNGTTFVGG